MPGKEGNLIYNNRKENTGNNLFESWHFFEMLSTVNPVGIYWTDAIGNYEFVNHRWSEISGMTPENAMKDGWIHAVHPDDRESVFNEWKNSIKNQKPFHHEDRFQHNDGSYCWVFGQSTAVMDEAGRITGYVGTITDITKRRKAEIELQHKQRLLNEAQRLGHLGSWELDHITNELRWSDEIYRIFGLDPSKFQPSYENFLNVIHPEDRERVNQAYMQSLIDHLPYTINHRLVMDDGKIKWVREQCTSDFDDHGKPIRSIGAVQDITDQKLAEDQLRVDAVAFETHEAILITDRHSQIIRVNKAFTEITGYSADEVMGKNPRILSSGHHDRNFYDTMWNNLITMGSWSGEIWDKRRNGQVYPKWLTITAVKNDAGDITEFVGIFNDITARKKAEEEIRNLAFYDFLTSLPNRRLLLDRFRLALSISARTDLYGAVLFMDMDRFKTLNDSYGHDYGDMLLTEVAERIRGCVREVDTVARFGGDEFVVLIENMDVNPEEASQKISAIAEKIRQALCVPYQLREHEFHSSSSIGVCLFKGNGESVRSLLRHADMAMYQAKDAGRNAVRFFDPLMQQAVELHASLETDLQRAQANQELKLFYQLQVDCTLEPVGTEALLRWIHPVRGMVSPSDFIPIAEESSLILEIGDWVLDTACCQLLKWSNNPKTYALSIAVNVSAQQVRRNDFVEKIAAIIHFHNINPALLKLELTESMIMSNIAGISEKMMALKELGIKLSMDDFGTGYSSLAYLKQLPLDQLKIDQSFIRDITTDQNDAIIVQTIINMAQNFKLGVIAEGVETREQLDFLKKNGCMAYQGYYFGKPVPIDELEKLLN